MRKIFLLLYLCSVQFAFADTEPNNDTPGGADIIAVNGTASGTVTPGNYDFYKLVTTGDGDITVSCTTNASSYLYASLIDSNGTWGLGSVTVSAASGMLSFTVTQLAAGTYYVRIQGNGSDTYTVSNTVAINTIPNDAEPNDSYLTALPLQLDDTVNGHLSYRYNGGAIDANDYYKITTVNDGDITVSISLNNTHDVNLTLIDSVNNLNLTSGSGTGPTGTTFTSTALAAGTYYIRVSNNFTYDYSGYSLVAHVTPTMYNNDAEPNGSLATAGTFAINSSTTGHIMHRIPGGSYDISDYYAVTIPSSGNLNVSITNSTGNNIQVNLIDNLGFLVQGQGGFGQPGFSFTQNNLTAGLYYIQVTANLGSEYSGYILNNNFTAVTGIDDLLKNSGKEVFPNPAINQLHLKFTTLVVGEQVLTVLDAAGKICIMNTYNVSAGENTITTPVDQLAKGIYLVTLQSDNNIYHSRFIKE